MTFFCTTPMLFVVIFFLTVNPPKIIQHPKKQSVAIGVNTDFSIEATGDKLLFQWKKNDDNLSDNNKYRGTKTRTLIILKVKEIDEAHYRCFVKNDVGELLSDPALLTVSKFLVATSCVCNVKLYNQITFSSKFHSPSGIVPFFIKINDDANSCLYLLFFLFYIV